MFLASIPPWPDGFDRAMTLGYCLLIVAVVVAGYGCMVLDVRAYLRSLRRALVVVGNYRVELPEWVRRESPRCIRALDLHLPCTADDVLNAYRQKVKIVHPDRGGDRREFMRLQQHFEQALALVVKDKPGSIVPPRVQGAATTSGRSGGRYTARGQD